MVGGNGIGLRIEIGERVIPTENLKPKLDEGRCYCYRLQFLLPFFFFTWLNTKDSFQVLCRRFCHSQSHHHRLPRANDVFLPAVFFSRRNLDLRSRRPLLLIICLDWLTWMVFDAFIGGAMNRKGRRERYGVTTKFNNNVNLWGIDYQDKMVSIVAILQSNNV
uniref:Uncharacterized protein n=1 Tax=Cucumis sativus TaxID=3659 RepID=A0A0A0L7J9_CUCSA